MDIYIIKNNPLTTTIIFYIDDPECRYVQGEDVLLSNDHRSQVLQFCGHDPICRKFNSPEALQRAKENVEKFYKVVGITENINMTLQVLEHEMPEYFEGGSHIYHTDEEVKNFRMKNAYKLPVSDEVMSIVRQNFTQEIEFYNFCKQRLLNQYENITKP